MDYNYNLQPGRVLNKIEFEQNEFNTPIISIVTPFFNSGKYIKQTANCVLSQTFPNFEWIIIDDGSEDVKSLEILEEVKQMDNRIQVFHKENEGVSVARDYGTTKTSKHSKYYLFLDDDDLINATYLECAYWTLESNINASWAYTDVVNFGEQEFLWRKWFNLRKQTKENLLVMTALVKKEAFHEVGGFGFTDKAIYEDWVLWLKLLQKNKIPVRMNFYGFWYRKKKPSESELAKSLDNIEKTMKYVEQYSRGIDYTLQVIQYPKSEFNWEQTPDYNKNVELIKEKNNGKIEILMIIPWMAMGGADKYNIDLIKRIDKEKFNITIISTEPSHNEWRQDFEEYVTVYDLTTFLNQKDWISFINYIIAKKNIDIIFNTNSTYGYSILPYLKAKYPKKPIMDYVHMEEWYNRGGGFSRDSSSVASVIDKTLVCNQKTADILVNYFNRKKREIQTVYIGADETEYNAKNYNREQILKQKKLKINNKFVISYICRIANQKRPYLLLEIIKNLKQNRNDFVCLVVGDGPLLEGMKSRAKKYDIEDCIIFLGSTKNTQEIYAISDITINCSIKEGLALTSYESLSMGVPVISADVGGQKELINKDVGIIVPCLQEEKDVNNFKYNKTEITPYIKAIDKILKNLEEYKQMCRDRVLDGFTINSMVGKMENIFEEVYENPNMEKQEIGVNLYKNLDITKELITKYIVSSNVEFTWLVDKVNETIYKKKPLYEHTLEYKIKHPIYLALNKIRVYEKLKYSIRRK